MGVHSHTITIVHTIAASPYPFPFPAFPVLKYDQFEFFVLSTWYLSRTSNLISLSYWVKKYSILYYISSIPPHAGALWA